MKPGLAAFLHAIEVPSVESGSCWLTSLSFIGVRMKGRWTCDFKSHHSLKGRSKHVIEE